MICTIAGFTSPAASIILLALLILEAVIFGIFTGVMFFNQMWAVSTDETVCHHLHSNNLLTSAEMYAVDVECGDRSDVIDFIKRTH